MKPRLPPKAVRGLCLAVHLLEAELDDRKGAFSWLDELQIMDLRAAVAWMHRMADWALKVGRIS